MKKSGFNAITLKKLLIVGIFPLLGVAFFFTYSLFGMLEEKSKQASHANIDSETSSKKADNLKQLEAKLNKYQDVAERAATIVADSRQYRYQDQIVNDINTYADAAGVDILGFNFSEGGGDQAGSEGDGASGSPAQEGSSGSQPAAPPAAAASSKPVAPGLKTINASIQLDSPIPLTNFLIFLKYIEQNITKMQVTGVTLTPAENPKLISNPTINITVYTR